MLSLPGTSGKMMVTLKEDIASADEITLQALKCTIRGWLDDGLLVIFGEFVTDTGITHQKMP